MIKRNFDWTGRIDSLEDENAFRWHQCMSTKSSKEGLSLLGFSCHAGVARNKGRVGAKDGPKAIRQSLASLPSNSLLQKRIFDAGDIVCEDNHLEQAQAKLSQVTAELLANSGRVITLGGGHEIAWGSYLGAANYLNDVDKNLILGVINFDAHFDLRPYDDGPSSGTPFLQMAHYCQENSRDFKYCCMGVSELGNTQALFNTADKYQVDYRYDTDMSLDKTAETVNQLKAFIESVDRIYLTIDLDVFPAYISPGVSAAAARGVSLELIEAMINEIMQSEKLLLADIAECNPTYDIDGRTAKLAARLVYLLSK